MECYIDGISHAGEGVARINGKATFIPFTIPGETVSIKIIEEKKNYQRAHLEKVVIPSSDRIDPLCHHYFTCGGCSYQHVNYERQLALKRQVVEETIKRIGGIDVKVNPVIGMDNPWRYRNKVEWHTGIESGEPVLGYYINNSHTLIDIEDCLLISEEMKACSRYIKETLQKLQLPAACEIIVRQTKSDDLMFIFNGTQQL